MPPPAPVSTEAGTFAGAGVAAAAVGGVLADAAVTASGVGLSGELLTDAALVGAVALGGLGVYAASRPDEAGQAARFVGGAVANTTTAYAELAAVNAELALLEQQQKVLSAVDEATATAKAIPGEVATNVREAPGKAADSISSRIRTSLLSVQQDAQAQLDNARKEIDDLKP